MRRACRLLPLLLLLAGCRDLPPLQVPEPEVVTHVDIRPESAGGLSRVPGPASELRDPLRIGQLLFRVADLNADLHEPFAGFPAPTHTVMVHDTANVNLVLFIGRDWLGGRNNLPGDAAVNRLRDIDANERAELLALLGVAPDPD